MDPLNGIAITKSRPIPVIIILSSVQLADRESVRRTPRFAKVLAVQRIIPFVREPCWSAALHFLLVYIRWWGDQPEVHELCRCAGSAQSRSFRALATANYPNTQVQYQGRPSLIGNPSTHKPYQLQAFLRARSYPALEWNRVPSKYASARIVTNCKRRRDRGRKSESETHLITLSSLKLAARFSSTGASILNRRRVQAILRKSDCRAKCCPGHILREQPGRAFQHNAFKIEQRSKRWHLLPNPNIVSSGSLTEGSSFPSSIYRSGSYERGLG